MTNFLLISQGAILYFFLLFQFIGLLLILGGFIAYAKHREIPVFFFIWHKKRRFFALEILMFAIITLLCIKPLYNNFKCFYAGHSLKQLTKYDWFIGQCQVSFATDKNGKPTYVPYGSMRGTSNSPEHGDTTGGE